jgi:glycosyltransferase involved in cell wall biosynthesis
VTATVDVTTRIGWIGVVVPAHNEQDLLPSCVAGLMTAAAMAEAAADVKVEILVVLDACTDGSEFAAAPAAVLPVDVRNVGQARRQGFAHLLQRRPAGVGDRETWLASTDADTIVPPDWLLRMLAHAAAGWTVVAGTVRITDWTGHSEDARNCWQTAYQDRDDHPHVHGANLGFRGDAYRLVGGMPSIALSEDVALVNALEAAGERINRAGDLPVVTSARRDGRADGGFAAHLRELGATGQLAGSG